MDKTKLLKLRNDIDRYLEKNDATAKVMTLDKNINSFTAQTVNEAFAGLGTKLDATLATRGNTTPELLDALDELGDRIDNVYKTITPTPDRTEDLIQAISNIRFPEVNFPNVISVDNFPPQKIPQPVTNVKSTIVADDTGLLQAIVDALGGASNADIIHQYGEQTVAAGNTMVLATYTVPTAKVLNISGLYGDGINNGIFKLYVGGVKVWQGRNAWTDRNVQSYLVYVATAGQVVELKVTNNVTSSTLYTGGFYGRQIDA